MASESTEESFGPIARDTKEFLEMAAAKLNWGELSNADLMMDIGCGNGGSSRIIAGMFPNLKRMIAIDNEPLEIVNAHLYCKTPGIKYYEVDIQDSSKLTGWIDQITHVVSIYCFHWINNQDISFQNVFQLLKSGGSAAILFSYTSPYYNCLRSLLDMKKWKKYESYLECYPDPVYKSILPFESYRNILERIGFEIVACELEDKTFEYISEDFFKNQVMNQFIAKNIPDGDIPEFIENICTIFEKQNGRSSNGKLQVQYKVVKILLRKK